MAHNVPTSNDLIDNLVRQCFGVEPDVMASLAHGDEEVGLRRLPSLPETKDPLDGVDVLTRRVIAMVLQMRKNPGMPVALVNEVQARAAGWPTARLANAAMVLAWGVALETEVQTSCPILLDADETATAVNPLIRVDRKLPSMRKLLKTLYRARSIDIVAMERVNQARETAPALTGRTRLGLHDHLQAWLGVDADKVELLADRYGRVAGRDARAALFISCLVIEGLELGRVMEAEWITAARLKTEKDAQLAGLPGATACNFSLLFGVAITHAAGCTVHVLPTRDDVSADLVNAGQRFEGTFGDFDDEAETVAVLEIQDVARRGYVHVGRRAARRVAQRLFDRRTTPAVRTPPTVDVAAP